MKLKVTKIHHGYKLKDPPGDPCCRVNPVMTVIFQHRKAIDRVLPALLFNLLTCYRAPPPAPPPPAPAIAPAPPDTLPTVVVPVAARVFMVAASCAGLKTPLWK